jgi:hypothetical protein
MTSELIARASYRLARARHHLRHARRSGSPIVVFSMAKTGSSAVVAGLRAAGHRDVFHVHDLDPAFLAREEAEYRWSGRPWRIWDAQQLLRRPPTPSAPWRVVSIVREPIAQSVSAFFQPAVRRGYLHPGATVTSLLERFGDRLDHLPLRWFETHVEPALGIDVYAAPFDVEARRQLLTTPTVRLLLLRCEDLDAAPTALAELLGVADPIAIPRVNVGAEKDYAMAYADFVAAVHPTEAQLERAYGSRPVRHFYTADEVAGFRGSWSARRAR